MMHHHTVHAKAVAVSLINVQPACHSSHAELHIPEGNAVYESDCQTTLPVLLDLCKLSSISKVVIPVWLKTSITVTPLEDLKKTLQNRLIQNRLILRTARAVNFSDT